VQELAELPLLRALLGKRVPELVDDAARVAAELLHRTLEVLRPEAQAGSADERLVPEDDVHLGVVEERVLVQIRRTDGQPAVVDDPDLRVHVHPPARLAPLAQRAGEESACAVVGRGEDAELAARVVGAVVRARRQHDDEAERVGRRPAQLVGEDRDDLRRPQELALEVDEPLRAAQGAGVGLEDAEVAARKGVVDALRDGPEELDRAFSAMKEARAGALIVESSSLLFTSRTRLADLALKNRLPTMFAQREYAEAGGLMAYSADFSDLFWRAATFVDKILKGAKPADLPVEQPTKFDFVINLKTAKALGLTIPPSLLQRADEVIQ